MNEEWRDIEGYEGLYQVSNLGRVRSLDRSVELRHCKGGTAIHFYKGKLLKPIINNYGYRVINLAKDGKNTMKSIHRLVAETFIPNNENKPEIDHIIPIKEGGTDEVTNLRWVTSKENANNEITIKRRNEVMSSDAYKQKMSDALKGRERIEGSGRKRREVYQYDKELNLVKIWSSPVEAGENGFCRPKVCDVCNGKRNHHKGFIWSYVPIEKGDGETTPPPSVQML